MRVLLVQDPDLRLSVALDKGWRAQAANLIPALVSMEFQEYPKNRRSAGRRSNLKVRNCQRLRTHSLGPS